MSVTEVRMGEITGLEQVLLNDLKSSRLSIITDVSSLDLEEKTVLQHEDGYFIIVMSIVDENYNMLSNFSVIYDDSFDIKEYTETHIIESDNGFFKVINYVNGVLIAETETELKFIENNEFESQLQELEDILSNSEMSRASNSQSKCVSLVLKIGVVVAALIITACIPICVLSLGAACSGCVVVLVPSLTKLGVSTQAKIVACMN